MFQIEKLAAQRDTAAKRKTDSFAPLIRVTQTTVVAIAQHRQYDCVQHATRNARHEAPNTRKTRVAFTLRNGQAMR